MQIYTPGVYLHRGVYCAYERGFSQQLWSWVWGAWLHMASALFYDHTGQAATSNAETIEELRSICTAAVIGKGVRALRGYFAPPPPPM